MTIEAFGAVIRVTVHEDGKAERSAYRSGRRVRGIGGNTCPVLRSMGRRRHEPVEGSVIGDQGRLIGLHRQAEEEGEVVLHLGVLVGGQGCAACRPVPGSRATVALPGLSTTVRGSLAEAFCTTSVAGFTVRTTVEFHHWS